MTRTEMQPNRFTPGPSVALEGLASRGLDSRRALRHPLGRARARLVRGAIRTIMVITIFTAVGGTRLGETMSALSSPRSPISVCARPIWPGGQSGEPWRLCLLESGASVTVRSRPPQAHSRSPPPLAPARLLAIVSVQLVEGRTGLVALS